MEEENILKISDYIISCINFSETQDDSKLAEINDFINKLNFREYIPLKEKEILIMRIMNSIGRDFDSPGASAFVEMNKVCVGLLSYCTNLKVDIGLLGTLYHAYDLMYQFGLVDAILKHCEVDYKRLTSMLDRALGFDNIRRIMKTAALFDEESYDKWIKTMEDLKTTMDNETLKEFVKITNQEDETSQEILRDVQKAAVDEVNSEILHQQEEVRNAIKTLESNEITSKKE